MYRRSYTFQKSCFTELPHSQLPRVTLPLLIRLAFLPVERTYDLEVISQVLTRFKDELTTRLPVETLIIKLEAEEIISPQERIIIEGANNR